VALAALLATHGVSRGAGFSEQSKKRREVLLRLSARQGRHMLPHANHTFPHFHDVAAEYNFKHPLSAPFSRRARLQRTVHTGGAAR
jgi:hypothetical protein